MSGQESPQRVKTTTGRVHMAPAGNITLDHLRALVRHSADLPGDAQLYVEGLRERHIKGEWQPNRLIIEHNEHEKDWPLPTPKADAAPKGLPPFVGAVWDPIYLRWTKPYGDA